MDSFSFVLSRTSENFCECIVYMFYNINSVHDIMTAVTFCNSAISTEISILTPIEFIFKWMFTSVSQYN